MHFLRNNIVVQSKSVTSATRTIRGSNPDCVKAPDKPHTPKRRNTDRDHVSDCCAYGVARATPSCQAMVRQAPIAEKLVNTHVQRNREHAAACMAGGWISKTRCWRLFRRPGTSWPSCQPNPAARPGLAASKRSRLGCPSARERRTSAHWHNVRDNKLKGMGTCFQSRLPTWFMGVCALAK